MKSSSDDPPNVHPISLTLALALIEVLDREPETLAELLRRRGWRCRPPRRRAMKH
jgi:hypothetical protein